MDAVTDILNSPFQLELQPPVSQPIDGTAAIYLFQPQQRLLLLSKPVLALHKLQQIEACISMSRLLSCYREVDKEKLNLAFKVAAEITGVLKVTLRPKTQSFYLEHRLQRLKYGEQCFLCGQLRLLMG